MDTVRSKYIQLRRDAVAGMPERKYYFPNLHRHRSSERMMQPSISASLRLTNAGLLASCLVFGIHLWNTEYGSGSSGVFLAGLEFQSCVCCGLAGLLSRVCSIDSGLRSAKL